MDVVVGREIEIILFDKGLYLRAILPMVELLRIHLNTSAHMYTSLAADGHEGM